MTKTDTKRIAQLATAYKHAIIDKAYYTGALLDMARSANTAKGAQTFKDLANAIA